jgi:hypothetical protein
MRPQAEPEEGRPKATMTAEGVAQTMSEEEAEESARPGAPYKFAILWFGIPFALVIASVFLRMQCGGLN